tara:strand:+ start:12747 stop:13802 length:1056 start_codon:yes stop_codon:yes gene_type:complete
MSELLEKEEQAVGAYDEFRAKLAEVEDTCNFIPDMSTPEGFDASKRVSLDVGKILTALDTSRKSAKADALAYGRSVDSEAAVIRVKLEAFQLPHKEAYKELAQMKKQREADRVARLEQRIKDLADLPELMRDSDSGGIKDALESLQQEECDDFYELTMPALKARNASKESLTRMFADKLKQESDAALLKKLQAENEERRVQEEKAESEAFAAALIAEAETRAAALVEVAKQAEQKAIEDGRILAEQSEKNKVVAAKLAEEIQARAVQAAKDAAALIAEEKENQAIAEQAQEDAARARAEADKERCAEINNRAAQALVVNAGVTEKQAQECIKAIVRAQVPCVSIEYYSQGR